MSLHTTQMSALTECPEDLARAVSERHSGIVRMKPRVLFTLVEGDSDGPVDMRLHVPSSGLGSITLLEASVLVSLLSLTRPERIFEFGTFLGYSTALLLRNSSAETEVLSIDLGEDAERFLAAANYTDAELRSDDKKNDEYLRLIQAKAGPRYLRTILGSEVQRLKLLHGDSTRFDVAAAGLSGQVDFVFVDGGHDTRTVTSDTHKALEMVGDNGLIVWHDFDSGIHSDVSAFIHGFARDHLLFHVEHTMLAFLAKGECLRCLLTSH